jgi:hypothetical protein
VPMKQVRVFGRVVSCCVVSCRVVCIHQRSTSSGRLRGVVKSIAALGPRQHVGPVACARLPPLPARRPIPRCARRSLTLTCDDPQTTDLV